MRIEALGVERTCEYRRNTELLRDVESELYPFARHRPVTREEVEPAELGCERRHVSIGLVSHEYRERLLHELEPLISRASQVQRLAERGGDPGSVVRRACALAETECGTEMCLGDIETVGCTSESTRSLEQVRPLQRVAGELDGGLERTLRVLGGSKSSSPLRRAHEPFARARLDRLGVVGLRTGAHGVEKVSRDHFRDLVRVDA